MDPDDDALQMLEVHGLALEGQPTDRLALTWESRRRSRLKATTEGGREVGLFLPRGTILTRGSLLQASDGGIIAVEAAAEEVSVVTADDPATLLRVAYHLGNRHLRTQVGPGFLRYRHDRSVDELVQALGAEIRSEEAPFEPERGTKDHVHDHDHDLPAQP
jgi:urease accessory protein